jgi:GNAT superfamily N-acetyltransferase
MFAPHHYLSGKYSGHRAFIACLEDGTPVAFASLIAFPHGRIKNGWRGHRLVVLPDFQGLGIGTRLDEWRANYVRNVMGGRCFVRTSHPRLGMARDASPRWRATSNNKAKRSPSYGKHQAKTMPAWKVDMVRDCWSHEYLGEPDGSS